jgi:SAM-dependent methyltransferase
MSGAYWGKDQVPLDRPSAARIYDYYLGGYHNFEIDRRIGDMMLAITPDLRLHSLLNRAFLRRVVSMMIEEGIDQFLDLGSGIPTVGNVHESAQSANPEARVVYVDIDPVAVAHGKAMLAANDRATIIRADICQPEAILSHPDVQALLDFERPLGLLLVAVLPLIVDDNDADRVVHTFSGVLAPGSLMAISHSAAEATIPGVEKLEELFGEASSTVSRYKHQIEGFFDGFDLVEPGLVPTPLWRPEGPDDLLVSEPERVYFVAAMGRKT